MSAIGKLKIGCVGAGNMGSAILSRLSEKLDKSGLICFDTDNSRLQLLKKELGIKTAESVAGVAEQADVIILAVKPDALPAVCAEIDTKEKIIVSIAAGISISTIKKNLKLTNRVIRVMPNTPALVGEGMSVVCPEPGVDKESEDTVKEIFSCIGEVMVLPEKYIDAVTALSGCGPAYAFTLMQAMIDGGVKMGIPREKAQILASQTVLGAAKMVKKYAEEPIILRGRVASPGGSTIEAIHILEREGFSGIVMDAIEAAGKKSEKLGK